ncbi:MAG: ATP-binding cassette domain-containing protein [Burkholderiaceae bacterium]|nr:ATP-binding cassette domain-containing protein [Burkholderiaceae bacterium]
MARQLLRTEHLTKRFKGLTANEDVDFEIFAGEIRCVIGPNGAGKTTFLSMISGHLQPTSGRVWFRGEDITKMPLVERARLGIARKFQTPSVFNRLTVYENIELAVLGTSRPKHRRDARVREVLELVRLSEQTHQLTSMLSHGQRQWLEVGLLIGNDADLMLLDEPTAGMTAEETHSTGELVQSLARDLSLSAIIIEHDINFIRNLDAPITVLHMGRVVAHGNYDEISHNEMVRDSYLGH